MPTTLTKDQVLQQISKLPSDDVKDLMETLKMNYCENCGSHLKDGMICPNCDDGEGSGGNNDTDQDQDTEVDSDNDNA